MGDPCLRLRCGPDLHEARVEVMRAAGLKTPALDATTDFFGRVFGVAAWPPQ